jgi:formylglycine-generating enzyme required for sulfatase activity
MPIEKTTIVSDQSTDKDALDFDPYVATLADIAQEGRTPLTIGVFGTWGSGKTSLMKMMKKKLPDDYTVAWFDAWKYDKEETLWRAFLLCVLTALKENAQKKQEPTEEFEKMQSLLYRDMELEKVGGVTIDLPKLGGAVATGLVKLSLSFIPGVASLTKLIEELQSGAAKSGTDEAVAAITRERTKIYIEQVQFLEQFQDRFSKLVKTHIAPKRLVVFVDDLDRCLPAKAIEVLESIKLFLDAEHCVFVLGLDQEVIARGIEMKYKELGAKQDGESAQRFTIEGARYLEKIIQLPFLIPPVTPDDMGDFVQGLADYPDAECPKIFSIGLGDNPRQIKRTVNVFLMLWKLAEKRKEKLQDRVKPIRLAKVVAIQTAFPDLYSALLKDEPRYLRDLEEYYRAETLTPSLSPKGRGENVDEISSPSGRGQGEGKGEIPPALAPFLSRRGSTAVKRILTLHPLEMKDANFAGLPLDDLKFYFTLTARAEAPAPEEAPPLVFEPQMIKIPAGKFLMGTTKEQAAQAIKNGADKNWVEWEQPQHIVDLSEYSIGKYPVTNREYQAFVRDANYKAPKGWEGEQFPTEKGGHPVVNVSWNDAQAYCKWLSAQTKKQYRLPTEAEWEKAARWKESPSPAGRGARGEGESLVYPWGNDFDPKKCNSSESGIKDTTDVGKFSPQGDSPYGCADMAGNVWDWCSDWFDENEYKKRKDVVKDPQGAEAGVSRVLRGGSWYDYGYLVRSANRGWNDPAYTDDDIGFRCSRSLP